MQYNQMSQANDKMQDERSRQQQLLQEKIAAKKQHKERFVQTASS